MTDKLIELRAIGKDYRGAHAVRDVSFSVRRGEIHALLGENGAGKSTLTKILAGAVQPSAGEMLLEGQPVRFATPHEALKRGIAMVYQETSLVPSLTVAQNLYLGDEPFFNLLRGLYIAAQQFLQALNFNVDPTRLVSSLGAAQRQMVEIARAVQHQARLIIFDEPTATLTPEEKHHFFGLVRRLKADGVSIVFISHALEEALLLADRITILRDGELVLTEDAARMDRDRIIQAMVGRTLSGELYGRDHRTRTRRPRGAKVLSVQNLSMGAIVKNNAFSLYAGQITGMFGLIGSGRTETAKIVAGAFKRDFLHGGEILLDGRPVRYRTPRPAVRAGIVYVTEDRKLEGFFETMSIAENIQVGTLAVDTQPAVVVRYAEMAALADEGLAVLVISSYLPEILSLSDRILVTRQGRVVEEFAPETAAEDKIMYAAVH